MGDYLLKVGPTPVRVSVAVCSECGYGDGHNFKCRFYPWPNGQVQDEYRCNYRPEKQTYPGGHRIPDHLLRCSSRKSLHDDEYCRTHRHAVEQKLRDRKERVSAAMRLVLRRVMSIMEEWEEEENRWEQLREYLKEALK